MIIELTKKKGIVLKTDNTICEEDITVVPVLQNKTLTGNGTYSADEGYAGFGEITVESGTSQVITNGNAIFIEDAKVEVEENTLIIGG